MIQKVTIEPEGNDWVITPFYHIFINGKEVQNCTSVDFSLRVDSCPSVTLEVNSLPEFEGAADVTYDFTPRTLEDTLKMMDNYLDPSSNEYDILLRALKRQTGGSGVMAREELGDLERAIEDLLKDYDNSR